MAFINVFLIYMHLRVNFHPHNMYEKCTDEIKISVESLSPTVLKLLKPVKEKYKNMRF